MISTTGPRKRAGHPALGLAFRGSPTLKIEAVIVCVDYADFLAETLPHNLPHFDRTLVITAPGDLETQELCRKLSVPYYTTNLFYKDGEAFNKSRGIDFGLSYLRENDWVVHLDADTYLPPMTRKWLEWRALDEQGIYGVDRVDCDGYEPWKAYMAERDNQHDYMCRVKVPPFPLLDRIAIRDYGGYVPIGYFQMWHASHGRRYPIARGNAEHTDVLHAIQWDAAHRHLVPEVIAVHLQSAPAALGANWKGRTTPRFAPGPDPLPYLRAAAGTALRNDTPRLYMG